MDKVILELRNSLDSSTTMDAERMLRSFFRTIEPFKKRNWKDPERISWEIYAEKDKIGFYVAVPRRIERLIYSRIRDAYPQADIQVVEDYTSKFQEPFTARMDLKKHFMFATKLDAKDTPLNSVLNSMSRLEDGDRMLLQITMLPINNKWQGKAYKLYRQMLFEGKKPKIRGKGFVSSGVEYSIKGIFHVLGFFLSMFVNMGGDDDGKKNTPIEREELKGTQKKISLPAFNTSIRIAVESRDRNVASTRLSEVTNSFIETDGDNEWRRVVKVNNKVILDEIVERKVNRFTNNKATTLELAPLVRLANKNINVPELNIKVMKTLPIPKGFDSGLFLGYGLYNSQEFPILQDDSDRDSLCHPVQITGAMGGGKTTLIRNMCHARAMAGYGIIMLDTQGDMSRDFLKQLPESEWHRVVWLNFGDLSYPVALDMLEAIPFANDEHAKFVNDFAKNELIGLFKKMFGTNFGPQTEYIVRHIITATMEAGESSFLEMFRMLVDDEYREMIASKIKFKAPFAWSFWRNFQDNFSLPQKMKMVMPSINKIGSFVENRVVRNITCQGLGSQNYSFRKMMDEGKIVVITIPKGKLIGTWQLIGSLILSKIWLATLSREEMNINDRHPCFLAVDEAEDLVGANDNFSIMLSQSRKFRLGLIFGYQFLRQLRHANREVADALDGNKPNIIALKIGTKDAQDYADVFRGYYKEDDMDFPNLHGIAQLSINGKPQTPFTLRIPYNFYTRDNKEIQIIQGALETIQENSRKLYAKPLADVERIVDEKYAEVLQSLELQEEGEVEEYDVEASEDMIAQLRSM